MKNMKYLSPKIFFDVEKIVYTFLPQGSLWRLDTLDVLQLYGKCPDYLTSLINLGVYLNEFEFSWELKSRIIINISLGRNCTIQTEKYNFEQSHVCLHWQIFAKIVKPKIFIIFTNLLLIGGIEKAITRKKAFKCVS